MERLTDDRFLKDGFYQPKSKEEEKEIRSMGNDLTFEKLYKHCAEVEKQNAELQKQVDELTKKREVGREKLKSEIASNIFMSASHGAIQCGKMSVAIAEIEAEQYVEFAWEMVQQAVKDTAKEILQETENLLHECAMEYANAGHKDYFGVCENISWKVVRKIAKDKGVEVE